MSDIDIETTIVKIIEELSKQLNEPEQEILEKFYMSDTYEKLKNPKTLLWTEGYAFICDRVLDEWDLAGVV